MESYEKPATDSSLLDGPGSNGLTSSPRALDFWQANRSVNGDGGVDSSSNDSDQSSPLHNESTNASTHHEQINNQHDREQDESLSSINETVAELSPINVDD